MNRWRVIANVLLLAGVGSAAGLGVAFAIGRVSLAINWIDWSGLGVVGMLGGLLGGTCVAWLGTPRTTPLAIATQFDQHVDSSEALSTAISVAPEVASRIGLLPKAWQVLENGEQRLAVSLNTSWTRAIQGGCVLLVMGAVAVALPWRPGNLGTSPVEDAMPRFAADKSIWSAPPSPWLEDDSTRRRGYGQAPDPGRSLPSERPGGQPAKRPDGQATLPGNDAANADSADGQGPGVAQSPDAQERPAVSVPRVRFTPADGDGPTSAVGVSSATGAGETPVSSRDVDLDDQGRATPVSGTVDDRFVVGPETSTAASTEGGGMTLVDGQGRVIRLADVPIEYRQMVRVYFQSDTREGTR